MKVAKAQAIIKIHDEHRVVKAPVLRPGIEDRQGTVLSSKVIEEACWDFNSRLGLGTHGGTGGKVMHTGDQGDRQFHSAIKIVESGITTQDEEFPVAQVGGEDSTLVVPAGSWMMAMKIDRSTEGDDLWLAVKDGKFRGFSIGGLAETRPIKDGEEVI